MIESILTILAGIFAFAAFAGAESVRRKAPFIDEFEEWDMNDPIQQEIEAKGLTAPRVTPADIEAEIASEHYFTAMQGARMESIDYIDKMGQVQPPEPVAPELGLLTFCVLVLRNGFTVTGESACASPENFDEEIGRKIARQNAVAKVWPLLGFSLRDAIHEGQTKRPPRYRCAETGEYVTRGYAEANPATTVKES